MELEREGEQADSGQRGTVSGQRDTAFGQHDAASDLDVGASGDGSDEMDGKSQAPSLATSADGSMELPVVMPDKLPVCFLCDSNAGSPSPLVDYTPYRPWGSYNKVKRQGVVLARKPTGSTCGICRNVYKAGGFSARYGEITEYKKTIANKDGEEKHAELLAALKAWVKNITKTQVA